MTDKVAIWFLAFIVCLSLSTLITVAQDYDCTVYPTSSYTIVGEPYEISCFASPRTFIISWRLGLEPQKPENKVIYHVDVSGSLESTSHQSEAGFAVGYYSLRHSTVSITSATMDVAGFVFCCALDIVTKKKFYCGSKLNVYEQRPQFVSDRIDVAAGIFTNINCNVKFMGTGTLTMEIRENKGGGSARNSKVEAFNDFAVHSVSLAYQHKITNLNITRDGDNRISAEHKVQTGFYCVVNFEGMDEDKPLQKNIEVDAPVTCAAIVPHSARKCSERKCRMHEKLECISDGRPKPQKFAWSVIISHGHKMFLHEFTGAQLLTLYSGRSKYQCQVFNKFENYNFVADAQFITHVEAFELVLDQYATFEVGRGSKQNIWSSMTVVAAVAGMIWFVMPPCATEDVTSR